MISTLGSTGPVPRPAAVAAKGEAKTARSADVAAAGKVAASSDTVTLTTPPALLAAQGAPIDAARVAAIRAQIANGTFRVDPQAIAARMIAADLPPRA